MESINFYNASWSNICCSLVFIIYIHTLFVFHSVDVSQVQHGTLMNDSIALIEIKEVGGEWKEHVSLGEQDNTFTLRSLKNNTVYQVRARWQNQSEFGQYSDIITFETSSKSSSMHRNGIESTFPKLSSIHENQIESRFAVV